VLSQDHGVGEEQGEDWVVAEVSNLYCNNMSSLAYAINDAFRIYYSSATLVSSQGIFCVQHTLWPILVPFLNLDHEPEQTL
jgi:hypothetical protein